ncbi:MAG: hypothetical protein ABH871_04800 [Pseudomonadota bacterium]
MVTTLNIAIPFEAANLAHIASSQAGLASFDPSALTFASNDTFTFADDEFSVMTDRFYAPVAQPFLTYSYTKEPPKSAGDLSELADSISQNAQGAEEAVTGAMRFVHSALKMLEPVFGDDNQVAISMKEGLAQLQGATTILVGMEGQCNTLGELLSRAQAKPEEPSTSSDRPKLTGSLTRSGTQLLFRLSSEASPLLGAQHISGMSDLAGMLMSQLLLRLKSAFPNDHTEQVSKKIDAFFKSATTFMSHSNIPGAQKIFDLAVASLIDSTMRDHEIRGAYYEIVRLAELMSSGRHFDAFSINEQNLEFEGWYYDTNTGHFIRKQLISDAEIDARDGDTFIEVKVTRLDENTGKYFKTLLERHETFDSADIEIDANNKNGVDSAFYGKNLANQLLKYRQLIANGKAKKLEFHLTCWEPIPEDVLQAMYGLFEKGQLEIIWYKHILSTEGILLEPPPPSSQAISQSEIEQADTPKATSIEELHAPDVVAAPQTVRSPGVVSASDETEKDSAPSVSDSVDVKRDEEEELRSKVSTEVYRRKSFIENVDNNISKLESFISWLLHKHKTELLTLNQKQLSSRLTKLFEAWSKEVVSQSAATKKTATSQNEPWMSVNAEPAQKHISALLKTTKKRLDWSARTTQGVQNKDIINMLAKLKYNKRANTALSQKIGEFIKYLKDTYTLGAYFKIENDGDRLVDIVRHYLWLLKAQAAKA